MLVNLLSKKPRATSVRWLGATVLCTLLSSQAWAFSIDDVAKQAQDLAGKGFEAPKSNLPSQFRDMKFADYQQIQFNHDKSRVEQAENPFQA
ncbi:Glucans biosynthesis protein G precursor [Serratia fonticola]|uniref:Glucans biosynthesis protein G n=1 Tax=Serratia fonticola TaxID=47917 RepID=A0A4U9VN76_SERFO|nr:Glucans biosynthesis protein G precursor [Serratia fonticola]